MIDYERWRNRGTTQLPLGQGQVIKARKDFDLFLTSDWHAGHEACYYEGLKQLVKDIRKDPLARVRIGGDQMEITPPGHHDGGRNSDSYIDGQIIRTGKALESIKGQIDIIYGGNHGKARLVKVGIDPDLILASNLGVPYATAPMVTQYITSRGTIRVCGGHGRGCAQDSMRELRRMREIYPNCDLYHLGHDHSLFAEPDGAMEYDDKGEEYWSPAWMCRTGSFLRYAEYARYGMYRPKPTGYLVAHIRSGKIKSIEVVKV